MPHRTSHHRAYEFHPVERNVAPAPIPHIITEENLPQGHKALVFLPHSDDGAFIGGALHFMNKEGRNDMKLVVVSPGHEGVVGDGTKREKISKRWNEALEWGKALGFSEDQMHAFRADKTYEGRRGIAVEDQMRMDAFMRERKPTMVFVPHISDTAQHINFNTRRMVVNALTRHIKKEHQEGKKPRIMLVEYPTNHIPILPPSDRNLDIFFSDPKLAEVKHSANKVHDTQKDRMVAMTPRMVEAIDALMKADDVEHVRRLGRRFSRELSGFELNRKTSRGEHYGLTLLGVTKKDDVPIIKESRMHFPLAGYQRKLWEGK